MSNIMRKQKEFFIFLSIKNGFFSPVISSRPFPLHLGILFVISHYNSWKDLGLGKK